jgi:hypothetical protein
MNCKNCGHKTSGNYCSHCGQQTHVDRITLAYLWHEILHFFTHIEHGFPHTTKGMLLRPGKTVTDFIAGKRIRHQSPVSYFLVWVTILVLLLLSIQRAFGPNEVIDFGAYFGTALTTEYAISHLSVVLAVLLPVFALYLFAATSARIFNYTESLVCITYSLGTIMVMQVIFSLFAVLYYMASGQSIALVYSDALKIHYLGWFTLDLFRQMPLSNKALRGIACAVLIFGTFTAWRLFLFPQAATLFMTHH